MTSPVRLFPTTTLEGFIETLKKHHHGRMQFRDGYKEKVNSFCIVRVLPESVPGLEGHISGPNGNHAKFKIYADQNGQILIQIRPEGESGFPPDQSYLAIKHAIAEMMKRQKLTGMINTKHWKGLYLINSGEKTVGKTGLANLEEAVRTKMMSSAFKESCLEIGFTMKKY